MNLEEFRNLDFEDPGGWPPLAKGIAAAAVVVFILVAAYFLSFKDQWQVLDDKKRQEVALKQEFEEKQQKAVNLEAYEEDGDKYEGDFTIGPKGIFAINAQNLPLVTLSDDAAWGDERFWISAFGTGPIHGLLFFGTGTEGMGYLPWKGDKLD